MMLSLKVTVVLVSMMLVSVTVSASAGGCNVTDPYSGNKTINLSYLSKFGNVSLGNRSSGGVVDISFCVPVNVTSHSGALCGSAFLAEVGADCADSVLFDIVSSPLRVMDQKTAEIAFACSLGAQTATVFLVCQAGLDFTSIEAPVHNGTHTIYTFAGDQVCAGYVPPPPEEEMLSKGAIVGIIIGIVGFVVITSALFQWRSRRNSDGDGYEQI
jgi:hypothetical protein